MPILHICEKRGEEQILTSEEGYTKGWDYPPKMASFKTIAPRTCGNCLIDTTLWWEVAVNKTSQEKLSERHKKTLKRISEEPESIIPKIITLE
jgi:hypothetical protein